MYKSAGRVMGRRIGAALAGLLAGVGAVALLHALETPQPLKSVLPGEAHLYLWQRRSIFYQVAGPVDAPPLVLLHRPAIGASSREMLPIMTRLSEHFRVYALDWLGFGLSDRPRLDYSAQLYGQLCQDFLREVVQRPATLVASGLSCDYAIAASVGEPQLCASLVLITPTPLSSQPPAAVRNAMEKGLLKTLLYALLSTRLAFWLARQLGKEPAGDFSQFYVNTHQLGAEHAAMALLAGKLASPMERDLDSLPQPVLLIQGSRSPDLRQLPPGYPRLRSAQESSPRGKRVTEVIEEAGQAVHLEQPEKLISALERWYTESALVEDGPPEQIARHEATENVPGKSAGEIRLVRPHETAPSEPSAPDEIPRGNGTPPVQPAPAVQEPVPTPAQGDTEAGTATREAKEREVSAYCVKCKQKRRMQHPTEVRMKNGRPAFRGICPVCGTQLYRIGGKS